MRNLSSLSEMSAGDAVEAVFTALDEGDAEALSALDATLRRRLLDELQRAGGDPHELGAALADAWDRADARDLRDWAARWDALLALHRQGHERPSQARALGALKRGTLGANILLHVHRQGPVHVGELADALGHASSAISRALNPLEQAGLVSRQRAGKYTWITLTSAGKDGAELVADPRPAAAPRPVLWQLDDDRPEI